MLTLPEVPGQFWTVHYYLGYGPEMGREVVIAPTAVDAVNKFNDKWFPERAAIRVERTKTANG